MGLNSDGKLLCKVASDANIKTKMRYSRSYARKPDIIGANFLESFYSQP